MNPGSWSICNSVRCPQKCLRHSNLFNSYRANTNYKVVTVLVETTMDQVQTPYYLATKIKQSLVPPLYTVYTSVLDTHRSHYDVRQTVVSERNSHNKVILGFQGKIITPSWGDQEKQEIETGKHDEQDMGSQVCQTWITISCVTSNKYLDPSKPQYPILLAWYTVNAPYRIASILPSFIPSFLNSFLL